MSRETILKIINKYKDNLCRHRKGTLLMPPDNRIIDVYMNKNGKTSSRCLFKGPVVLTSKGYLIDAGLNNIIYRCV